MSYHSVVVTGANRGIGLQFVKDLVKQTTHLIATARDVEKATELKQLASKHPNLHILKLEVGDYASHPSFVAQVEKIVGDKGLQLLINNAGVMGPRDIELETQDTALVTYNVNAIGPIILTRQLIPLLKKSVAVGQRTISAYISSILGSIELNNYAMTLGYRMSKTALNQGVRTLANHYEDSRIEFILFHPGHVATDMGNSAPYKPPVTPAHN